MAVARTPTKRKGGPVQQTKKKEIMDKLQKLIESGQIHGVANYQLSAQFNVARETISKYLDEIYSKIPKEDLNKVYIDFTKLFDRLFREANKMLSESTTKHEKEKTMRLILQLLKEKTDFLERFFIKSKAAENINVREEKVQLNINLDISDFQQIQELESRRG